MPSDKDFFKRQNIPPKLGKEDYEFIDHFIDQPPKKIVERLQKELDWYQEEDSVKLDWTNNREIYREVMEAYKLSVLYIGPGSDIIKMILDGHHFTKYEDVNAMLPQSLSKSALVFGHRKIGQINISLNDEGAITLARMYARQVHENRIAETCNFFTIRWNIAKVTNQGIEIIFKEPEYAQDCKDKKLRLVVTDDQDDYTKLDDYSLHYNLITAFRGINQGWSIEPKSKEIIKKSLMALPDEDLKECQKKLRFIISNKDFQEFIKEEFDPEAAKKLDII